MGTYIINALEGVGLVILLIAALIFFLATVSKIFTTIPKGQIKVVMVGEKPCKYLADLPRDRWIDPDTGEVIMIRWTNGIPSHKIDWKYDGDVENPPLDKLSDKKIFIETTPTEQEIIRGLKEGKNNKFLREKFGLYVMHWNPLAYIYKYLFTFNKIEQVAGSVEFAFVSKSDEIANSLFQSSQYGIKVNDAKTGGPDDTKQAEQIPVELYLGVQIEITDASKALWKMQKNPRWLGPLTTAVEDAARGVVGKMTLDELARAQHEGDNAPFYKAAWEINRNGAGGNPSIIDTYGVKIIAINLLRWKISATVAQKVVDASTVVYEQQRTGEALLEKAKKEAQAVKLMEEAKVAGIVKRIETIKTLTQPEQLAALAQIETAEGIRDSKITGTLILGGQPPAPIIPVGGKTI